MKARVWKDRDLGMWRYEICGGPLWSTGASLEWRDALSRALAELALFGEGS